LSPDDYQLLFATSAAMRLDSIAKTKAGEDQRSKDRGYIVRGRRPYNPEIGYEMS